MARREAPPDTSPLTLHLDYTFLPVLQQATVLGAIGATYETIAQLLVPAEDRSELRELAFRKLPFDWYGWYGRNEPIVRGVAPPLSITSAATDSSITFKFGVAGAWLPHLTFAKGELEVIVPRWTAIAVLTGAALTWGLGQYNSFLETQKNALEIDKLRLEIEKLQSPDPQLERELGFHVQQFRFAIDQPNLTGVHINGIRLDRPAVGR